MWNDIFCHASIMTRRHSAWLLKNYVPFEYRSVRLREIWSKEVKSEKTIVETYSYIWLLPFCMWFVHNAVHRKLSSTTSAIWLWHVCLPVFSLHSAPTKFRRIRIYLFGPILEKYETVFWRVSPQTRLTFALCIGKVIWKIGLVLFARNKH